MKNLLKLASVAVLAGASAALTASAHADDLWVMKQGTGIKLIEGSHDGGILNYCVFLVQTPSEIIGHSQAVAVMEECKIIAMFDGSPDEGCVIDVIDFTAPDGMQAANMSTDSRCDPLQVNPIDPAPHHFDYGWTTELN